VRRLEPGTELNFDLYGSPGGNATVRIDGATRNLHMTETRPGTYQGTYTIGVHDRLRPDSQVTANLRAGGQVTTRLLGEALVRGPVGDRGRGGNDSGDLAAVPHVDTFDVRGSNDLGPGNELKFTVFGTPGAKVDVQIAGTRGIFTLPEVRPGEYAGLYTIRRDDNIAPDAPVTATIRANGRYTTAALGRPLLAGGPGPRDGRQDARPDGRDAGPAPRDAGSRDAGSRDERVARYCTNCATVEAVNVVQASGQASAVGTLGGAAVGGLLGNQVGSGNGRTAATVAGAAAGALAGRSIERNARSGQRFDVVVRYENGATQNIAYDNDPGFRVGERVKVNGDVLVRD